MKIKLLGALIVLSAIAVANGPKAQEEYIDKYKDVAIREMKKYGIPASITLAQGLLESGSGQSYLAVKANNHFGIKCHLDWTGKKVYKDDDARDECFRAYKNPDESFRDHSLFLVNRSRYASLFEEDPTDYKAWAKGLKKAGYATNRKYDNHLIDLIERFDLDQYDQEDYQADNEKEEDLEDIEIAYGKKVSDNYVDYVIAQEGDGWEDIAEVTNKYVSELLKYNEVDQSTPVKPGQRVYLQPKRNKAAHGNEEYRAQQGDTMYSISQKFGIKLEKLYKRNDDMESGQEPEPGQVVKLR